MKNSIYKYKSVINAIYFIINNFQNWDTIIKRALGGKSVTHLITKKGLIIKGLSSNTLSIYKEIFAEKVYSKDGFEIEENSIVFDIGANIGIFSLFASKTKNVKIYAFEPHPINFNHLQENILLNNLNCIQAFCVGVAGEDGNRQLMEGDIPGGHIMCKKGQKPPVCALEIKIKSLSSILLENNIKEIDFLKMDCEGSEGEIIINLDEKILKKIKKIVLEFHDNASIINHDQILNIFSKSGFTTELKWNIKSPFGYIYAKRDRFEY